MWLPARFCDGLHRYVLFKRPGEPLRCSGAGLELREQKRRDRRRGIRLKPAEVSSEGRSSLTDAAYSAPPRGCAPPPGAITLMCAICCRFGCDCEDALWFQESQPLSPGCTQDARSITRKHSGSSTVSIIANTVRHTDSLRLHLSCTQPRCTLWETP